MEEGIDGRRNELRIGGSALGVPANTLRNVCKSICKIIIGNIRGSGFLIKLKKMNNPFYCLITCEHVISKDIINAKRKIEVLYDNQFRNINIVLDKTKRFIRDYKYLNIDATVIEILDEDNIEKNYFLEPDLRYLNDYGKYLNKMIYIPQFPGGGNLNYSSGRIKSIDEILYEFSHLASTEVGSSGSPIFLQNSPLVIGIHKQGNIIKNENYGNFLYPIFDSLKSNQEYFITKFGEDIFEGEKTPYGIELKGQLIYKDGKKFVGTLIEDKPYEKGIIYNKDKTIFYEGEFDFGIFEGTGKIYYENGDYYIGKFENNKRNGKGTLYEKNGKIKFIGEFKNDNYLNGKLFLEGGDYYVGPFVDGKEHGKGKIYNKDNILQYEGEFSFGRRGESGTYIIDEDRYYIGEMRDGLPNGKGLLLLLDTNDIEYEGEFVNSFPEGKGTEYGTNGYYKGDFVKGKKEGKGIFYSKDNKIKYEGDFVNNEYNGNGKYIYDDESYYIGEIKNGKKNGNGILFNKDHTILYEGEFVNDEFEGEGTYYYENGDIYKGHFNNSCFHGKGKLIKKDGKVDYEGEFVNNRPDKCIIF